MDREIIHVYSFHQIIVTKLLHHKISIILKRLAHRHPVAPGRPAELPAPG